MKQLTKLNPSEREIQNTIMEYLALCGIPASVTDASRAFGKDGRPRKSKVDPDHPDISAVLPVFLPVAAAHQALQEENSPPQLSRIGLAFYIEVKTATGSIRDGQKKKLLRLSEMGAICILARSIDDVAEVVEQFLNKNFSAKTAEKVRLRLQLELSDRRLKTTRQQLDKLR